MELCETCTKTKAKCKRRMKITKQDNLTIIKCLDYDKDKDKIQGYIKPKERTAKYTRTVMGLYNPSWN